MATNYSTDEEEDDSQNLVTCDNCLEYEGHILNPRTLPCQHVFCTPCLEGQQRNPGKAFCAHKDCLRQHQVTIDALPSALGDLKMCCDTCAKKKGEDYMTAMTYCVQCDMKYCKDHHEAHDELNTHRMMRIKEYLQSSFAHELRYCDKHKQEVYSLGCSECSQIFCADCINSIGDCKDGSQHKLVSLKKLADDMKNSVEPLKIKVEDKFDDISAVIKETTIKLSEWDIETDEGVRLIHKTRDEQLNGIREVYTKLEHDYMDRRKSSKEEITNYLAEKVGLTQAAYLSQLKILRTDLSYRHPVDFVSERVDIEKKITALMSQDFPKLVLQNQIEPVRKDSDQRDIELELLPIDDFVIGGHRAKPPIRPPTGLKFVRQAKTGEWCYTVCQYKGYTYVGLGGRGLYGGGVDRIDEQGKVTSSFITSSSHVMSMRAHNDRLYTLVYGQPYKVCVYDIAGQTITSWDHPGIPLFLGAIAYLAGNRICIFGNKLVAADTTYKRLTLYTLNGDIVRHINCPFMGSLGVAMCEAGGDSIIITDSASSKVFRLNLASGVIQWESTHVPDPLGVVCYGRELVLVTTGSMKTRVLMLDIKSGEIVGELTVPFNTYADVFNTYTEHTGGYDLAIDGDLLIIPRYVDGSVKYYRLLL